MTLKIARKSFGKMRQDPKKKNPFWGFVNPHFGFFFEKCSKKKHWFQLVCKKIHAKFIGQVLNLDPHVH
jgi:hypothetical protein